MPSLSEEITIPSPVAEVWPLLADPALVATCIPGASLTATEVSGVYQGTMRVKFGPTVATFRGEARIAYHPDTLSCTIEGRGIDGRGQSRANASGAVHVSGQGDETVVQVEGNFTVTGPLESFANAGGVHVARALLAEFSQNIVKLITSEGDPAPEAEAIPLVEPQTPAQQVRALAAASPPAPVTGATELRGGALLWRAALLWLKQVFDRQRAPR
jgi:carbon monoxide dehydrogenase subunit G